MEPIANTFMKFLSEIRKGAVINEASEKLSALVEAVKKTGRPGELRLKVKLTMNGENAVMVDDDLETKMPKKVKKPSLFFTTEDNQLTRQNPEQQELGFAVVDGEKNEATAVAATK